MNSNILWAYGVISAQLCGGGEVFVEKAGREHVISVCPVGERSSQTDVNVYWSRVLSISVSLWEESIITIVWSSGKEKDSIQCNTNNIIWVGKSKIWKWVCPEVPCYSWFKLWWRWDELLILNVFIKCALFSPSFVAHVNINCCLVLKIRVNVGTFFL